MARRGPPAVLIAVRYHEIALKGRNRPFFVHRLVANLRQVTSDLGGRVEALAGRVTVEVPDDVPWPRIEERVASTPGIANYSRVHRTPPDLQSLKDAALRALADVRATSFRVATKRSHKGFPLISTEIDREVGGAIKAATGMTVDLDDPALTVFVEVLRDRILFSFERRPGPGGFPVGSSGRVAALLSGGIDSPVATWRMMKRG